MKQSFPFPLREDTFPQCWKHMDSQRRKARVRVLTAKSGGFFSNLVFLFSLFLCSNALILRHFSGSYCTFLQGLPFFADIWERIHALLPSTGTLLSDLTRLLLLSYCIGVAVFAVIFLLTAALYHPRKRSVPEESYPEALQQLAAVTRETWNLSGKTHISSSVVAVLLVIASVFILFFAYTFYLQDAQKAESLLSSFLTGDAATNALLCVFFGYFLGHCLCLPVVLITRPLYYTRFPYDLVAETASAALFSEKNDGLSEEEILRQRLEDAARIREEGIRTEYSNGYRIAKDLYWKAALGGDIPAMEHYARHCLLSHQKEPARYWLTKAADSGKASAEGKNMLLRLKMGRNHNLGYLQEGKDNSLKAARRRTAVQAAKTFLITAAMLGGAAAAVFAVAKYVGEDPASLLAEVKTLFSDISENIAAMEEDTFVPEEVLPFRTPVMELTEVGTGWEGACVAYNSERKPILFCYGKDLGGSLAVPCNFADGELLHTAGIYAGNKWDIRNITSHVTYEPRTKTVTVSEEYLQKLAAGEYFLILNDGARYIPLLVTEQTVYNSTQRGFAASGNDIGWIVNDLEDPQDITLPFYNLGDNTIRTLFLLSRSNPFGEPSALPLAQELYTISEDGRSVTVHRDFWQMQTVGTYVDFQVRLANGDLLTTEPLHIGTVQGETTALLKILGDTTYSLSGGGDYTARYQFEAPGVLDYFIAQTDGGKLLADESLSKLISRYIDFDAQTITLPQAELKQNLKPGEGFHIYLAYVSQHNQYIGITLHVEAVS